jgi:hypothetical protein
MDAKVEIYDYSLAPYCSRFNTCKKKTDFPMINWSNGWVFCPDSHKYREEFFEKYKNDEFLQSIDGFICTIPISFCQLFMPFNKPIFIVFTVHYGLNFLTASAVGHLQEWRKELISMIDSKKDVVIYNHKKYPDGGEYDEPKLRVKKVKIIPHLCEYVNARLTLEDCLKEKTNYGLIQRELYNKIDQKIHGLIDPIKLVEFNVLAKKNTGKFEYSSVVKNIRGMVLIPWVSSLMSMFETFTMNIPMFIPSAKYINNTGMLNKLQPLG